MPNEVEITITATDLTGPAFASALTKMTALRAAVNALGKDIGNLSFGNMLDVSKMDASLMQIKSKLNSLGIADLVDINIQPGRIMTQLQLLKRMVNQAGISDILDFNVNDSSLMQQLSNIGNMTETIPVRFDISKIPQFGPTENITDKFSILGLDAAAAQLAATREQTALLAEGFGKLEVAKDSLASDLDSRLTPAVKRSGQNFGYWGGILGGSIGHIGLWHVALDGAVEAIIAVGTATAAAAIGMAAMSESAMDIYTHLEAVRVVNSSLYTQIPPLTGKFDQWLNAMAPQTIEAFGGGLTLLNSQTGILGQAIVPVVTGFDDWIAKMDIWIKSQGDFGKILDTGVGFLHQFGQTLGALGGALDNLVKADPGTAHFLMDIVSGAAGLLNVVTKIPSPILESALAVHSFYVWGSVASGILGKLPGQLGKVGGAFANLGTPAKLAVSLLAVGAFEMARAWDSSSGQIASDISNINASLSNMSASQAVGAITTDIGKLNQDLEQNNLGKVFQSWDHLNAAGQVTDDLLKEMGRELKDSFNINNSFSQQVHDIANVFGLLAGNSQSAVNVLSGAAWIQAKQNAANVDKEVHNLLNTQEGLFIETGKLSKAGYSFSQSLALMDLAGVRGNDTFQIANQKVQNLIKGYQQMSVSGGLLKNSVNAVSFASLQQNENVSRLNQGWDAFFQTVSGGESAFATFGQDLAVLNKDAQATGANMAGLNANSLTLRQGFLSAASAANSQMDSLTTLANAAALGQKGTDLLVQASKDLVSSLLPAARDSSGMTTILYTLAQHGGYTGADSFKALSAWVGKTHDPMSNLNSITTVLTKSAGNLTQDVQNLSVALGTTLNQAMAQAAYQAYGGEKGFSAFADSVVHTGVGSYQTGQSAKKLADELYALTGSTRNAQSEFMAFAEHALGLTKQQATTLWKSTLPGLQNYIDKMHGKTVDVTLLARGAGKITFNENTQSGRNSSGGLVFMSGGGLLPGYGGGDTMPAMLERGETVIDKDKTKQWAWLFKAMGVPGFAHGGYVPKLGGMENWFGGVENYFAQSVEHSFAAAAIKQMQQAINQAVSGGHPGPGGGNPAANYALAKRLYPAYVGTPVFSAWNNVAMAESGWNNMATNPTSGAFGIGQALPFNKMPRAAWPPWAGGSANPTAQETWMWNYMAATYGGPIGAWQHEQQFHWYDDGGWLQPGPNYMYNGTGRSERLVNATDGIPVRLEIAPGGSSAFEQFMIQAIRNWVRLKGGGSVQQAFGRNS